MLIAHSLGCRVALHAASVIRDRGTDYRGPRVSGLYLMAAAVPVDLCRGDGQPYGRRSVDGPEVVFHSKCDRALGPFFSAGQHLLGEPGVAVGRHGGPAGRWLHPVDTGLGHGKYWGSSVIADEIGRTLGRLPANRLGRQLDLFGDDVEPVALDRRALPGRHLETRRIRS